MSTNAIAAVNTTVVNAEIFHTNMDRLTGACIGVIAIRTRETERARSLVHEWASIREMTYRVWTPISGLVEYKTIPIARGQNAEDRPSIVTSEDDNSDYMVPIEASDLATIPAVKAFGVLEEREASEDNKKTRMCATFMGMTQGHLDDPGVQQHIRNHVQRAYTCDDRIVIIMQPGVIVPASIMNDIEIIDLPTPSYAELLDALSDMDENIENTLSVTLPPEDKQAIVQNGMGMTMQEFENAISLAIVDLSQLVKELNGSDLDIGAEQFIKVVRERKLEILKSTQVLELLPQTKMSDVGGLDLLKGWLDLRAMAFGPDARDFGIKPPKGFIIVGPPGGGKSLITNAVCNAFGQAGIRLDIGKLFGAYVGQSEEQTRAALKMIEGMAPCVVQIDEIEKAFGGGGGGGDGGVGMRVFGTILTWMQDRADRGIPVFIVASANDVTKIPPELLRKGRFDAIFGISFPTIEERQAIIKIHVEKRGHKLSKADILTLAKATDTFVGAELESIIEEALFEDLAQGNDGLTLASVISIAEKTQPQIQVFPQRIAEMREFVEKNARPASSGSTYEISTEPMPGITKVNRRPKTKLRLSARRSSEN